MASPQQCYFPDGSPAPNDTPCDTSAAVSPCCGEIDTCFENGLCTGGSSPGRGSCTDRNWGKGCPEYCQDFSTNGGRPLYPCSEVGLSTYSGTARDCNSTFVVEKWNPVLRVSQVAPLGYSAAVTLAATDTLGLPSSSPSTRTSVSTASSCAIATSTSTAVPVNADARFTSNDMAAVGAGVGVPLLLAVMGLAFLLYRQKESNKTKQHSMEPHHEPTVQQGYNTK